MGFHGGFIHLQSNSLHIFSWLGQKNTEFTEFTGAYPDSGDAKDPMEFKDVKLSRKYYLFITIYIIYKYIYIHKHAQTFLQVKCTCKQIDAASTDVARLE